MKKIGDSGEGERKPREAEPRGRRGETATPGVGQTVATPRTESTCACGGICPTCRAKAAAKDATKPHGSAAAEGAVLEPALRRPMERVFGESLADVRVHSGAHARAQAESRGAYALTFGRDIHLGARGQALPEAPRAALLAHEVAHALQQPKTAENAVSAASTSRGTVPQGVASAPEHSPEEREADAAAHAFMADRSGAAGMAVRAGIGRRLSAPRVHLARYPTFYGEFEDYKYNEVKDSGGTSIGVQAYLKFHPGNNVDAKKIGMTQAAAGRQGGARVNSGFYGRRQATSGAGTGYFIDTFSGFPHPLYGTPKTPTAGQDASKLESYPAPGINAVTQAQLQTAGITHTGINYGGGAVYGYRYTEKGALKGPVPAEMHDAPHIPTVANDSEQVFETAALAFEGTMAGTYLGSIEWGWRRDAKGTFSTIPISVKSMAVPSANFLTAANIWNAMKADFGLLANVAPTNVLKADLTVDFTVPQNTPLRPQGAGTRGGVTYLLVDIVDGSGRQGVVAQSDTVMGDFGQDTIDLPVPEVYTVNVSGGTVLDGEQRCSPNDPTLPQGTRVRILGPYGSGGASSPYVRVEVVDGALTGRRGVLQRAYLTREALGTR